jgi:hypothetical protein
MHSTIPLTAAEDPPDTSVVALSRYRQQIRRAMFLADDRRDSAAVERLSTRLFDAEELEMATPPTNAADARQKLINAAIEAGASGVEEPDLLRLAGCRQITAQHLRRLRERLAWWEADYQAKPFCGAERVITPLRFAIAFFRTPVLVA